MPPRKKIVVAPPTRISIGSGITAGLELWNIMNKIAMYDSSIDKHFTVDVATWNTAAGLNATHTELIKNAASKDTT